MTEIGSGAGTSYPGGIDTNASPEVNGTTDARAEVPQDLASAVIAVESTLGVNPQGLATDLAARLAVRLSSSGEITGLPVNIVSDANIAGGINPVKLGAGVLPSNVFVNDGNIVQLSGSRLISLTGILPGAGVIPAANLPLHRVEFPVNSNAFGSFGTVTISSNTVLSGVRLYDNLTIADTVIISIIKHLFLLVRGTLTIGHTVTFNADGQGAPGSTIPNTNGSNGSCGVGGASGLGGVGNGGASIIGQFTRPGGVVGGAVGVLTAEHRQMIALAAKNLSMFLDGGGSGGTGASTGGAGGGRIVIIANNIVVGVNCNMFARGLAGVPAFGNDPGGGGGGGGLVFVESGNAFAAPVAFVIGGDGGAGGNFPGQSGSDGVFHMAFFA